MNFSLFDTPVLDCVAYFDWVTVWLTYPLTDEQLAEMAEKTGAKIDPPYDKQMRWKPLYKQRLFFHQPTREQLRLLQRYIPSDALVNYGEFAYDFIAAGSESARMLQREWDAKSSKTFQRRDKWYESGIPGFGKHRPNTIETSYTNPRHSSSNLAAYSCWGSKVNGKPCLHVELRLSGKAAMVAAGVTKFSDLATFDLVALLRKRVILLTPKADILALVGRDLIKRGLVRRRKMSSRYMGIYRLSNPSKRAANLVLRALQMEPSVERNDLPDRGEMPDCYDSPDCYDMEALKNLDKATGLKLVRHFERVAAEKVFSSTEVR